MLQHTLGVSAVWALTSGPSQPEFRTFSTGNPEMVDLFTGDFTYDIPLFELPGPNGGYPFNLNYRAGITLDQEASWVGLGWNLTPGAIQRQVRGIPDDFKGDILITKQDMKPNRTINVGLGAGFKLFGADFLNGQLGYGLYHNSYRGFGYTFDASFGLSKTFGNGKAALGLGLNTDSQEGANLEPNISFQSIHKVKEDKYQKLEASLGIGFNSVNGLQTINFGVNNAPYNFNLARQAYTPRISMPSVSSNLSFKVNVGGAFSGTFTHVLARGHYNQEVLKYRGEEVKKPAYGYLYHEYAGGDVIMDMNRAADGVMSEATPNLPMPIQTYDFYNVTGYGVSGTFRAFRNDVGILKDDQNSSEMFSSAAGADVGIATHAGGNRSIVSGKSTSGPWQEGNSLIDGFQFNEFTRNKPFEAYYFKEIGDNGVITEEEFKRFDGENAAKVNLTGTNENPNAVRLQQQTTTGKLYADRAIRNKVMLPITKGELSAADGESVLKFVELDLESHHMRDVEDHHIVAFLVYNTDGTTYVYGLPLYNYSQKEHVFSVSLNEMDQDQNGKISNNGDVQLNGRYTLPSGTDQYSSESTLPRYAYAYLLTAVLGQDYVDVDENGVSEADLGYWVKFSYSEPIKGYAWKMPFKGAAFNPGSYANKADNTGSFVYGTKDIRYLTQAETKSHVAFFETNDQRADALPVSGEFSSIPGGALQEKLRSVTLYTRSEFEKEGTNKISVKKVSLFYNDDLLNSDDLCEGVPNALNGRGKLTLEEVYISFGQRNSGIQPYTFEYNDENYQEHANDQWGNFYPHTGSRHLYFPYIDQTASRATIDEYSAAWSLKSISLPSGGKINIQYEADDYAYVQHREAMALFQMTSMDLNTYQVRFKMKERDLPQEYFPAVNASENEEETALEMRIKHLQNYTSGIDKVYFKAFVNLKTGESSVRDFVSGYAELDRAEDIEKIDVRVNGETQTEYYGVIKLKPMAHKGDFHPIQLLALQHLRVNLPQFLFQNENPAPLPQFNLSGIRNTLVTAFDQVKLLFSDFNGDRRGKGWASSFDPEYSWIRLRVPDGIKYGGGLRVKQIIYKDNMYANNDDGSNDGQYGKVYDYTMEEVGPNGELRTVSSGVAAMEPGIGGEENPLRQPKPYQYRYAFRSFNNLFFEYPINESYYPGPSVGYRKVTVMSLPAAVKAGETIEGFRVPEGVSTTGKTEYEFYTAKEFPVYTNETNKIQDDRVFRKKLWIPLIGTHIVNKLTSTQGYSIVTNDMHGRPKKTAQYRQLPSGVFEKEPYAWTAYTYKCKPSVLDGKQIYKLDNYFAKGDDHSVVKSFKEEVKPNKVLMGIQQEMFLDMNRSESRVVEGGVSVNLDFFLAFVFPIPVPTVWPNISSDKKEFQYAVCNKIIQLSGFVESVETFKEGALISAETISWDKLTGSPLVTAETNMYDQSPQKRIYKQTIPAYHQYHNMGPAYANIGLKFDLQNLAAVAGLSGHYTFQTYGDVRNLLSPGDRLVLYNPNTGKPQQTAVYIGQRSGAETLYVTSGGAPQGTDMLGWIYASGRRNLLGVPAGTTVAVGNPVDPTRWTPVQVNVNAIKPNK